jgi:hypothetical protein
MTTQPITRRDRKDDMAAKCIGKSALFESVDSESHEAAKALCDGCDFIDQCRKLRDTREKGGGVPYLHGTWAGELWFDGKRMDPQTRLRIDATEISKVCADCDVDLPLKPANRRRCSDCQKRRARERGRAYDHAHREARIRDRGEHGATSPLACPRCPAGPGEPCLTSAGEVGYMHSSRRTHQCECGASIVKARTYCEPCGVEHERARWREKARLAHEKAKAEREVAA